MERIVIPIAGTIETYTRRKDGTLKVIVGTQELHPNDMAHVAEVAGKLGWFTFSTNELRIDDIPKTEAKNDGEKSMSARLRSRIYVLWKKKCANATTSILDADTFYKTIMEQYLEDISQRIETEK